MKTKTKAKTTLLEGDGRVRRTREADERTNEGRSGSRRSLCFVRLESRTVDPYPFLGGISSFFRDPDPRVVVPLSGDDAMRWLGSFLTDHEPSK